MKRSAYVFTWQGKWEKFGDVLAEKKVTLSWLMNSDMVKPEKLDHRHLVYHFTVPLRQKELFWYHKLKTYAPFGLNERDVYAAY